MAECKLVHRIHPDDLEKDFYMGASRTETFCKTHYIPCTPAHYEGKEVCLIGLVEYISDKILKEFRAEIAIIRAALNAD